MGLTLYSPLVSPVQRNYEPTGVNDFYRKELAQIWELTEYKSNTLLKYCLPFSLSPEWQNFYVLYVRDVSLCVKYERTY